MFHINIELTPARGGQGGIKMKKRVSIALAVGLLAMSLAGCGENKIPDLTNDQMQKIGEFTAITLMKYDAGNRSRLVDISLLGLPDPTPEPTPEPTPAPTPSGMDPVDDTPVIGGGTGNSSATMEEVLELPEGLSVVYMGEELHKIYYPEDKNDAISLTAAEGKQILVLNFSIMNASNQDQSVDFLSMAPEFRITVNDTYTRRALPTVFENDMPLYKGVIPAMQSIPLVILIEVEDTDAANLTSISLNLKNESKAYTIQLL